MVRAQQLALCISALHIPPRGHLGLVSQKAPTSVSSSFLSVPRLRS